MSKQRKASADQGEGGYGAEGKGRGCLTSERLGLYDRGSDVSDKTYLRQQEALYARGGALLPILYVYGWRGLCT